MTVFVSRLRALAFLASIPLLGATVGLGLYAVGLLLAIVLAGMGLKKQFDAYRACVDDARCNGTPESACNSKKPPGDWTAIR